MHPRLTPTLTSCLGLSLRRNPISRRLCCCSCRNCRSSCSDTLKIVPTHNSRPAMPLLLTVSATFNGITYHTGLRGAKKKDLGHTPYMMQVNDAAGEIRSGKVPAPLQTSRTNPPSLACDGSIYSKYRLPPFFSLPIHPQKHTLPIATSAPITFVT